MTEPTPASSPRPSRDHFLLVACQPGSEEAVFLAQQAFLPEATRAAWRKAVVTFRLPEHCPFPGDFDLPFSRTLVRSLGQVTGSSPIDLATAAVAAAPEAPACIHVWQRVPPLRREPKPGQASEPLPSAVEVHAEVARLLGHAEGSEGHEAVAGRVASRGETVLDLVIDSADRAWVGWHQARSPVSCWPGGIYGGSLPEDAVSRAWLKLDEALAAFEVPVQPGQRACELGAAPGGASQRLLGLGLKVVGIDPAEIDPRVAEHANFEHWQMRARDLRLKQLRGFDWLVTDMNIDPSSTMDALERAATAPGGSLRGIIATLKLPRWSRAADLPAWCERFRAWDFTPQARQLSCGGREVCVVACRPS